VHLDETLRAGLAFMTLHFPEQVATNVRQPIVKVTSPLDHDVSNGHLCVKGRFDFEFVQGPASQPVPDRGPDQRV